MWSKGVIGGFNFSVKHYDNGSPFGINGGRISKLWIAKDGFEHANYDRGWDRKPSVDAKPVYEELIRRYN